MGFDRLLDGSQVHNISMQADSYYPMKYASALKKEALRTLILVFSLCVLVSAASAIGISGEEKTIFTAEEGASIYPVIDSGNVLICEVYPETDDIPGWSRLYLYDINKGKLEELSVDNPPDFSQLDIYGNTVVWKTKSGERDWVEGQYDIYAYNLNERNTAERIAGEFNSVNGVAIYGDSVIITGRNSAVESSDYDHGDTFVYNLEDGSLTRYELPGCQSWVAVSGNNLAFQDDSYGQTKNMVYLMNLETGEIRQLGDEEKGIYSSPDISGDKIVYRFDEDFGSFLKDIAPQQLLMTDISTNETTIIASPDVRIRSSPKIDEDNIVWTDRRNGKYSVWLYNLNEGSEILISATDEEYGGAADISGDTVIWTDSADGREILKMIKLDLSKTTTTLTKTTETFDGQAEESPSRAAGPSSILSIMALILGFCRIIRH